MDRHLGSSIKTTKLRMTEEHWTYGTNEQRQPFEGDVNVPNKCASIRSWEQYLTKHRQRLLHDSEGPSALAILLANLSFRLDSGGGEESNRMILGGAFYQSMTSDILPLRRALFSQPALSRLRLRSRFPS